MYIYTKWKTIEETINTTCIIRLVSDQDSHSSQTKQSRLCDIFIVKISS